MANTTSEGYILANLRTSLSTFKFNWHVRDTLRQSELIITEKTSKKLRSSCLLYGVCFSLIKSTDSTDQVLTILRRDHKKAKSGLALAGESRVKVSINIMFHHNFYTATER